MQTFESKWIDPAGVEIYAKGWEPEGQTKAVLLLQHGLGEHVGRYEHVAAWLCQNGIAVIGNDRSGHGRSGGKRGHIAKYEYTLLDILTLHKAAQERYGDLPIFLYGHSMGGGIVLSFMLRNQWQNPKVAEAMAEFRKNPKALAGVIATSPSVQPGFKPSGFDVFMGKIMRKIYGGYAQNNGLKVDKISRDPQVVATYKADPLVHDRISAETGIGLLEWGTDLLQRDHKLPYPLLLVHGTADALTSPEASAQFVKRCQGDIQYTSYPNAYHELHNEPDKEKMLAEVSDWILSKIPKSE